MSSRPYVAAVLLAALALVPAAPALAQGEILITQAKANAGNVTPGDAAGFPVTLTLPGAYVLGSNLNPPAGKIGIQVTISNVTIDLNGFLMHGSGVAWHGITGGVNSVTIQNGTITQFKFDGIHGTGTSWTVENIRLVFNGRDGIRGGHLLRVAGSTIYINQGRGIVAINQAVIQNSTIVGSGGDGVVCENHCHIEGNMISQNQGIGVSASLGAVLGNTISGNTGFGLSGSFTGFGNNTLVTNNGGGSNPQISGTLFSMEPNACFPACP